MVTLPRPNASSPSAVSSLHGCARKPSPPRRPSRRPRPHGKAPRHRPEAPHRAACPAAFSPPPTAFGLVVGLGLAARDQRMHAIGFGLGRFAGGLAHHVARRVQRQRVEPGGERAAAAIVADRPAEPGADFLRDVFGIGLAAAPAPGDAIDEIIVPFDQRAEGRPVALLRPPISSLSEASVSSSIIAVIACGRNLWGVPWGGGKNYFWRPDRWVAAAKRASGNFSYHPSPVPWAQASPLPRCLSALTIVLRPLDKLRVRSKEWEAGREAVPPKVKITWRGPRTPPALCRFRPFRQSGLPGLKPFACSAKDFTVAAPQATLSHRNRPPLCSSSTPGP